MSDEHLTEFKDLLDKAGFWEMPATISHLGLDGMYVTIEAWKEGKYHVVHRWSPGKGYFEQAYLLLKHHAEYTQENEEIQ